MAKNNDNVITMVVEIPKGSSNKYEFDVKTQTIILDRVLYGANFYPGEYGFIPHTLDYDGDPLDVISLISYPTFPGCHINIRVLGAINMIDNDEIDTKLFGVVADDPRFNSFKTLNDVPSHLKDEITNFFLQYKALQNKKVVINGWSDANKALAELATCQQLYTKFTKEMTTLPKAELVKLLAKK